VENKSLHYSWRWLTDRVQVVFSLGSFHLSYGNCQTTDLLDPENIFRTQGIISWAFVTNIHVHAGA